MAETDDVVTPSIKAINRIPGVFAWRVFAGSARVRGGYIHGGPEGIPDICVSVKGRVLWLEAKVRGKEPSAAQVRFAREAKRRGDSWDVIESVRGALSAVRQEMSR